MSQPVLSDYKTPLVFSCVLLLGMFLGVKMADQLPKKKKETFQLDALVRLIDAHYVDSLNTEELYQNGIEGILTSLDPHTVYIPKEELVITNEELEGSFYGIGTEFFMAEDTVMLSRVVENSPAMKSGLQAGDRVLRIDTTWIAGKQKDQDDIVKKIRGKKDSRVSLVVLHPNKKIDTVSLNRDLVAYTTITAAVKLNAETGYIAIRMFNETTYDEFLSALNSLKKQGIQSLIIDVRDNPGGYMDAVASIADELIPGKELLISTRGKQEETKVFSEHPGLFETGKLTVCINENSASASEILAGITQDLDRGKVVGRRSYGKGLVQEQFELPDHSAIRITTARYYLPSGRCIQKNYAQGKDKYHDDLMERYHKGEFVHGDSSVEHKNTTLYYTKTKRKVYANEGISPDIFIAADTSTTNGLGSFYREHIAEQFAYPYLYNRKKEKPTVQEFYTNALKNTQWWQDCLLFLQRKNKAYSPSLYNEIKQEVLAQMAMVWYGQSGEAYVRMLTDDVVQNVLR